MSIPSAPLAAAATSPTNSPSTTAFSHAPIAASLPLMNSPIWPAKFRSDSSTSCRKATFRLRAITAQEAWVCRDSGKKIEVPQYLRQVVEEVAFQAREDKRVDRRSGVSQRLPITTLESLVSSAEQRAARTGEKSVVARVADVYAALPAITGKMELEYEGELKGGDSEVGVEVGTAGVRVQRRESLRG